MVLRLFRRRMAMNKEEKSKAGRLKWLMENGYTEEQATKIVYAYERASKDLDKEKE
jgi:uncharacterized protein